MTSEADALRAAAVALGVSLDRKTSDRLLQYLVLLRKWSRVYNLTAVRDPAEMLPHHLFDSLSIVRPLRRELANRRTDALPPAASARLLDVGSGAGLPGAVIALCCPEVQVVCVDAVGKKAAFVSQAAAELTIGNLTALHSRVESLRFSSDNRRFDAVCARAFAPLADLVTLTRDAVMEGGFWLAMKGKRPTQEIAGLPADVDVFHVEHIGVPGLDAERCIVWMRPGRAGRQEGGA